MAFDRPNTDWHKCHHGKLLILLCISVAMSMDAAIFRQAKIMVTNQTCEHGYSFAGYNQIIWEILIASRCYSLGECV